jgi:hypothetical protein
VVRPCEVTNLTPGSDAATLLDGDGDAKVSAAEFVEAMEFLTSYLSDEVGLDKWNPIYPQLESRLVTQPLSL